MAREDKFTKSESTIVMDANNRQSVIELRDRQINVKTLKLNMSRKHRWVMGIDLITICFCGAVFVLLVSIDNLSFPMMILMGTLGILMGACAIGKAICDFRNWVYTMQCQIDQMGEWYCEDVVNICSDLLKAGATVVEEEVVKTQKCEGVEDYGEKIPEGTPD